MYILGPVPRGNPGLIAFRAHGVFRMGNVTSMAGAATMLPTAGDRESP